MTDAPLALASQDGAVARLVLNRPQAGNSLSHGLVAALHAELDRLVADRSVRVIILSGAGGRIFCAGHDLGEMAAADGAEAHHADITALAALMQAVMAQPQIVIAKVEGVATAAGLELVSACDLAIASSAARFAVPGVNIGFWCHTPQVQLTRVVGRKQAMMMLATGKLFSADHALSIGLVNEVVDLDALDARVDGLAAEIASKSGHTLAAGKASFHRQLALDVPAAYALVRDLAVKHLEHRDAKEGIAAFLEKRPAAWDQD